MTRLAVALLFVSAFLATACGQAPSTALADVPGALPVEVGRDIKPEAPATSAVGGMNEFGVKLLRELRTHSGDNVVVSPLSVSVALGMVYAGARGTTAQQMAETLGYPQPDQTMHAALNALMLALEQRNRDGVRLAAANQVWQRSGLDLLPQYAETLARNYGVPPAQLDFEAQAEKVINAWVAERTNNRITELFADGSFTANTALVLANALYLDANWQRPFDPESTVDGQFTRLDGSTVTVPMMHNDRELPSAGGDGWVAAEIPYAGKQLSMAVIIPDDLRSFERRLTAGLIDEIFAKMADGGIHFAMPKTSMSFESALPDALTAMGMGEAFGGAADFSGMTGSKGLWLDQVEHEVFIAIDETGTEAAAATGAEMAGSHGPTIEANRPYVIVIRDRPTGAILFLGVITDPSKE